MLKQTLSKLASTLEDCKTRYITVQYLPQPQAQLNIQAILLSDNGWWTPIIRCLDEGHFPGNRWEATRIKTQTIRFLTQGGMLYKKSFTHPLLRYLSQEEGLHVLKETHGRCCGSDIKTWTLANKALRAGQRKFLLVAIDYFTKWVEPEHLARITEGVVMKFIWKKSYVALYCPEK
ncbi:UNVERIFIED_CONTAM: hypothetical protein Sangu_2153200 [Sesamum angustifolium]|uniref:Uncharacterized protein n=1 Tax=Sesamum angustifolium TaxID=2727405 RepID=A0AAW2LDZ3_9LAMI